MDIADPSFDPYKLSIEEKIELVYRSNGLLVNILQGLKIGYLNLHDGLKVNKWLSLDGCTSLTHLPDDLKVGGDLNLGDCTSLIHLPDNLEVGGYLYLN